MLAYKNNVVSLLIHLLLLLMAHTKPSHIFNLVIHYSPMMITPNKLSTHRFSQCSTFNPTISVSSLLPLHLFHVTSYSLLALFKQLTTITGRHLSLTSSHLLPTDTRGYVMAKNIHPGMNIFVMNEEGVLVTETVANVSDVMKQGYMAPLTAEGTLIVNNVAASCYATIDSHYVAHAAVAPMRWWYGLFGLAKESNDMIGVHWFARMLYEMTSFLIPSIIHQ